MYAIFLRKYKGEMVPLKECVFAETEQKAMWYCVLNPQYTYRKINDCEVDA